MVSHDTIGDLASLLHDGQSYRIRRDPVRRTWLVSLLSERGDVLDYGEAPTLEAALAQLVVTLEAVAAGQCAQCARAPHDPGTPNHDGSDRCRSGSIASGGTNAHCTCDTCY